MSEPIWEPIEEDIRVHFKFDTRILVARRERRTWRERLLSWPWEPWVTHQLGEPDELGT